MVNWQKVMYFYFDPKKFIIVHSKMKSLYQMYGENSEHLVGVHESYTVEVCKYILLNTFTVNLSLKVFIAITFFGVEVLS